MIKKSASAFGLLDEIVGRMPAGDTPLDKTPRWKPVLFAWRFGAAMEKFMSPLAYDKRFVQAALEHWYARAVTAADELKTAGTLDAADVILLRTEATRRIARWHYLVENLAREVAPPGESTESSLKRVTIDVLAYRRLLRMQKVRPEVSNLVLETFRNDCRLIGDPERRARLSDAHRKEAQALSMEANAILAQIDHPLATQPATATRPGEPMDFAP